MTKPNVNIDEKVLLQRLHRGDTVAFEKIYHLYKRRLAGNLLRLLKSDELVEELLQELFLKLWYHRERIDTEQSVRAYLFRISENMVYDLYRTAARDKKMRARLGVTQSDAYTHIEEAIFDKERAALLERAISQLPPKRQKIFRLSRIDGQSYEEISQQLGISKSTVNDHLLKANRFLKDYFTANKDAAIPLMVWAILHGI